ncbi:galactose-1-phosphate uridylyltransferase [Kitasatospora sp. NBC_00240]|uniref:galactose-1-phosphate uridylyltransferase n=1 Tax=Kitasatospora sp. NBC_00240 TaxID=2903567 RepID=UPI0022561C25|nr:galactose-1-phosphate uridylyltransferase [Kitasatospora sp. NBC_00240]MCX5208684.1 galactose-1-phosphate uridylyltransferase [Kitasatospora sp. NBC_00240]
MNKTITKLADGRELIYYDARPGTVRTAVDSRALEPVASLSEVRRDPVTGDWVTVAAHRQGRTYHPPADQCPLCPSRGGRTSEVPDTDYEVVVFENRFPSLGADAPGGQAEDPLRTAAAGTGRCEVVCFTPDHEASFADLGPERVALVLDAWTDRTAELAKLPDVRQVYCFENRGAEIGVTLAHSHGQIYALPFVTPRTARMARQAAAHRESTGRNLFEDLLAAELDQHAQAVEAGDLDHDRVVLAGEYWTAFVPFAARWPYEVHLYPNRRVPDLTALTEAERAEFPSLYLDLLGRFDRLFVEPGQTAQASPTPYIAAWHQAPSGDDRPGLDELALHLELFTVRRTAGKLKYLAGVESGMDAFVNDVSPEAAARRLREVAR